MANGFNTSPALRAWLYTLGGILLYALSLDLFLVGNNIAAGGISGIAVVLNRFLPVNVAVLIYLMNVPILLAALITNGWRYAINTIIGATLYSGAIWLFDGLPTLTRDPVVAAVFGGAIYGAGMAFLTIGNGSTGGTDLLNRLLIKRFPTMSVGKMSVVLDGAVVVLAMAAFGNIETGLYAIITICLCSVISDRIVLGFNRGCICMIITSIDAREVAEPLMKTLGRAVTRLEGTGMYSGAERNMLILAMKPSEVPKVKRLLPSLDPGAFVMLLPANELIGGNFNSRTLTGRKA